MRLTLRPLILASLAWLAVLPAAAEDWPTHPVTLVVPFAAGGPVDTIGRIIAAKLGDILGQQVVVENQGGAGGMIASARVAKSPPDGYTVLLGGSAVLAQNQAIYKKPLVDGATDFAYVTMFADQARILLVRKDLPVNSLIEFNAYAKANGSKMQYGSAGAGSGTHVCPLLLDSINGTKIAHVAYRGASLAMQDVIAGRLDFLCEQISTAVPQIETGTVKAIAVLGPDRAPVLPNLPSAKEQGIDGLDCGSWAALLLPKGTPDPIVRKLADATNQAVESKMVIDAFDRVGVTVPPKERRTPEYLAKITPIEIERWGKAIRAAGLSLD